MARAFDSIKQGLNEAITQAKSKGRKADGIKRYQPHAIDFSGLCKRLKLT